jgi:hypothetical protein
MEHEGMNKKRVLMLACFLVLASGLTAQEKKERKALKNADVVSMAQNHIDDDTLVKLISMSATDFDVSGPALIELKKEGVAPVVLRAMVEARMKGNSADAPAAAPSSASASAASPSTASPSTAPALAAMASNSVAPASAATSSAAPGSAAVQAAPPAASGTSSMPPSPASASGFAAMPHSGANMRMNPQQMAMMQSQMASMGPMLSSMMGGMSLTSYSAEQMPHVFLMAKAENKKQEVSPSVTQIAQSKFKGGVDAKGMMLRSLAEEGLSFAAMGAGPGGMMAMSAFSMASGHMPGMRPGAPSVTYVWGLPGRKSTRELNDTTPMFELSYGDIPGIDPDRYEPALVKLVRTKDNYRLVGATRTKMNGKSMMAGFNPENGKWVSEERCPIRVDKEERGFYVLHVDQPLEPGEYAVVLRPVKNYKAAPSGFGGGAQVFYSTWDFSVPGVVPDTPNKKKRK